MKTSFALFTLLLFVLILSVAPVELWAAATTPDVAPNETMAEFIGGLLANWGLPVAITSAVTTIILWALGFLRFRKDDDAET